MVADASAGDSGNVQLAGSSTEHIFVVGRISDSPNKHYASLEALADYLAAKLDGYGPESGKALVTSDVEAMAGQFRGGTVDILSESAFTALRLVETAGADILLREWKKGVSSYRTIFFVRDDSPIQALDDLVGQKIAFEDPGSTSAFLLPYAVLREAGHNLVALATPREAPPPDAIGYAFANSEINIATWVATGVTNAGAFSDSDWQELARTPEAMKSDLRVVMMTEPVIRSVIVVRGDMPSPQKDQVKSVLLDLQTTADGRAILKQYNKVERYDEIEGEAAASLERARQLYQRVLHEVR